MGSIFRDYKGSFIATTAALLPSVVNVTMKEGLAILEELKLARELVFENIAVQTNCLYFVKFVNKGPTPLSSLGFIFSDLLAVLLSFQNLSFSHVSQTSNQVTHRLTVFELSVDSP